MFKFCFFAQKNHDFLTDSCDNKLLLVLSLDRYESLLIVRDVVEILFSMKGERSSSLNYENQTTKLLSRLCISLRYNFYYFPFLNMRQSFTLGFLWIILTIKKWFQKYFSCKKSRQMAPVFLSKIQFQNKWREIKRNLFFVLAFGLFSFQFQIDLMIKNALLWNL